MKEPHDSLFEYHVDYSLPTDTFNLNSPPIIKYNFNATQEEVIIDRPVHPPGMRLHERHYTCQRQAEQGQCYPGKVAERS